MRSYHFQRAELTADRRAVAVQDVTLVVEEEPDSPDTTGKSESGFLTGRLRLTGELAIECPPGGNPLRQGMQAQLRLTGPHRRWTCLAVVILENLAIGVPSAGLRSYRWSFLVCARPGFDPLNLFPKAPVGGHEISLEQLLGEIGGSGPTSGLPEVQFTSEGGFRLGPTAAARTEEPS
jgi:hypothetical protein